MKNVRPPKSASTSTSKPTTLRACVEKTIAFLRALFQPLRSLTMNISQELNRTFDLATLRREAKHLRKDTDWQKARGIMDHYAKEGHRQTKRYYDQYDTRVEKVMKGLINQRGAKVMTFKPRFLGADQFDKRALHVQAHRTVQHDHHRRMIQLANREKAELSTLLDTVKQRNHISNQNQRSFSRAANQSKPLTSRSPFAKSSASKRTESPSTSSQKEDTPRNVSKAVERSTKPVFQSRSIKRTR